MNYLHLTPENRDRVVLSHPNFYHTEYNVNTLWDKLTAEGHAHLIGTGTWEDVVICTGVCAARECLQACLERHGSLIRAPTDNRCFKFISNRFQDQNWHFHQVLRLYACPSFPGSLLSFYSAPGEDKGDILNALFCPKKPLTANYWFHKIHMKMLCSKAFLHDLIPGILLLCMCVIVVLLKFPGLSASVQFSNVCQLSSPHISFASLITFLSIIFLVDCEHLCVLCFNV